MNIEDMIAEDSSPELDKNLSDNRFLVTFRKYR